MSSVRAGAIQYLIHHQLSAGGMGAVHLGTMIGLAGSRRVALKRIRAHDGPDHGALERLIAEAQLVFRLTHGNICQVLDLASSDQGTFMVMEFVDGVDLQTLLRLLPDRTLDVGGAIYVAREVARALDYAHRRTDDDGGALCLVHGDVKPQNVLLSREGEVKLADFGVARALGTVAPGNSLVGGTRGFMAPEAIDGLADHRADIYALGVTLAAALGARPGEAGLDLEALGRRNSAVTPGLLAIVARATARRPDDRYASAAEMEQALSVPFSRILPPFSPSALGRCVAVHGAPARAVLAETSVEATLFSMTSHSEAPGSITIPKPRDADDVAARPPTGATAGSPGTRRLERPRPHARRLAATVAALGALAAAGWLLADRVSEPTSPTVAVAVDRAPARRQAREPVAAPAPVAIEPAVPTDVEAGAREPHPEPARDRRTARSPRPASPPSTDPGFLTVNAYPWGVVFVDGKRMAPQTPAYRLPLAPGKHRVHVFNPESERRSPVRSVQVRSGKTTTIGFEW